MVDVIIIGGGSAGLFLANCLRKSGVSFLVIEKREHPATLTKAIGIHPPALKLLNEMGLLEKFLENGVKITEGRVFIGGRYCGKMKLGSGETADHVLSIPQYKTEHILEAALPEKNLLRGHRFVGYQDDGDAVRVETANTDGETLEFKARFLIGADGMNSPVRSSANIQWVGQKYPYGFSMGDFPDSTTYENRAVIHLNKHGLTESFPLPDGNRRWVINHGQDNLDIEGFCEIVSERTGHMIPPVACRLFSNFEIHRYLAVSIFRGKVILLGDAAHVMSPIGGQSMNVAWLHAEKLARLLANNIQGVITSDADKIDRDLRAYEKYVIKSARKFSSRAEFNTKIGLPGKNPILLTMFVKLLLRWPLSKIMSDRFTMRTPTI